MNKITELMYFIMSFTWRTSVQLSVLRKASFTQPFACFHRFQF